MERTCLQRFLGLGDAAAQRDGITLLLKGELQPHGNGLVVFYDEDARTVHLTDLLSKQDRAKKKRRTGQVRQTKANLRPGGQVGSTLP